MTTLSALLTGLALLGALSPLLTFATLFQQKEWRLDRLREHLRRDGWMHSLVGETRINLLAFLIALSLLVTGLLALRLVESELDSSNQETLTLVVTSALRYLWLGSFAVLSVAQIVMHKQRMPVRTSKALTLVSISLMVDAALMFAIPGIMLLLPVMQQMVLLVVWFVMKPVDFVLKKRVMDRAMNLRSQMEEVTVIGIAGSVGKTTVKELIAHLLQDLDPAVTPAHVNTEMGVAQWLTKQSTKGSNLFVVEMGAYRKGEIALLCRIAQPTIGVMTALGSDHLALFGSEQNIIDANGELIDALPKTGHAFFYGDNDGCRELAKHAVCPATIVKTESYTHPLQGHHNDYNVSLAVAVAKHMDVQEERIEELLKTFKPQSHTFTVTTEQGVLVLDDTYNISPLSLGAALDWAAEQKDRPRVLLTSGLQETGSSEAEYLQELGAKAATCVERAIFTDKHGSDIFAKAFGKPVEVLGAETERVETGSVLLAVGRMPLSRINRLLPTS